MVRRGGMTSIIDYENDNKLITYLAHKLLNGQLALVLGAGISRDLNLPDWKDLSKNLYANEGNTEFQPSDNPSNDIQFFVAKYLNNDEKALPEKTRIALYNKNFNCEPETLAKNSLLSALGFLVMSSARGNMAEVITLNFDNLLELYLSYNGIWVNSVTNEHSYREVCDVEILHPHGYLPSSGTISESIILSEKSFKDRIDKQSESAWNRMCLAVMTRKICIFVGISGKDGNINSLSNYPQNNHPAYKEGDCFFGLSFSQNDEAKMSWEKKKVFCRKINEFAEIPPFLFSICQKAAQIRTRH